MNRDLALPGSSAPAIPLLRLVVATVLAVTAAVLAGEMLSAPLLGTVPLWGGLALAAWCGALLAACAALAGRSGLGLAQWKLGSWFMLWYAGTSAFSGAPLSGLAAQILPSSIARAEWLVAVAVTAWAAAYCAGPRTLAVTGASRFIRSLAARRSDIVRSPLAPWLLYAAGTAARLAVIVQTGHLGDVAGGATGASSAAWYHQLLTDASLACPVAVAVAGLRAFREQAPATRLTLTVLAAAECAAMAFSGSKTGIVTVVAAVAITRACAGRQVQIGLLLAAVAFFLLIVIPFIAAYRVQIKDSAAGYGPPPSNFGPVHPSAEVPAISASAVSAASPGTISQSVSYLAQRLQEIDTPAIVLQKTPSQVPYASPAQLPEALAMDLVPRALWPGKPIIDPGYQVTQVYYGSNLPTGSAITPPADLWRYGGWVPVLVGMAFLGCLMRVLDDALDVRASPHAALLVLLLRPALATPEGGFTDILAVLPGLVLTWLVITTVTFRRRAAQ